MSEQRYTFPDEQPRAGATFFEGLMMVRAVSCGGRGSNAPPRFTSQRGGSIFHLAHHSMKTSIVRYCVATRLPCSSSRRGPWLWPWGSRWRSEWRSAIPVFSFHPWFFFSFKGLTNEYFSLCFRWQREDKRRRQLKQLLLRFTTKFALSTQYPHCH